MYADDICLMAPSPAALEELINICYDFSVRNDLSVNSSKSYCMVFNPIRSGLFQTVNDPGGGL